MEFIVENHDYTEVSFHCKLYLFLNWKLHLTTAIALSKRQFNRLPILKAEAFNIKHFMIVLVDWLKCYLVAPVVDNSARISF